MKKEFARAAQTALREDVGKGDITTTALIPKGHRSLARIVTGDAAVVCGLDLCRILFKKLDNRVTFESPFKDGQKVRKGSVVATLKGPTRALVTGERVALNFLSHLSGVATTTDRFVQKARPARARILDTRKTTPGLRALERYAVRCGGGENHRYNLNFMIMIKDNHIAAVEGRSLKDCISQARRHSKRLVEIEVDTVAQFKDALLGRPDHILLDNMNVRQIKQCVKLVKVMKGLKRPGLEASGGITLQNVGTIARTGVERISVGQLTHSRKTIDFKMEVQSAS